MEIIQVTSDEYTRALPHPYHIYNTVAFSELNSYKCDEVIYLIFKDKKIRLGIIGGIKNDSFNSPFSAPFGGFSISHEEIKLSILDEAIDLLNGWLVNYGIKNINLTLPPYFYNTSLVSKQANCLFRKGYKIGSVELNHIFNLQNFDDNYRSLIWYNAKKNLVVAEKNELKFKKCLNETEKENAYHIITKNREYRGYPLRMTWAQVCSTIELISSEFFLVLSNKNEAIASAIVFNVNPNISQVIYWGDLPGFQDIRPMNFLAYKIFEFYKGLNKKFLDIGPSTEKSVPNYGLCEFKESIGCEVISKMTFQKQ